MLNSAPSNSRRQQLEELRGFTDAVNKQIADIVGTLGWTVESVTNAVKEYLVCPYDSSHRLTAESLDDHLVSCQWKVEGYGKSDVPLSESTLPDDSVFSVKFNEALQAEVLRKAREQDPAMRIDFTSDERRALYDYVIAHTEKPDTGRDIADINNLQPQDKKDKELSFLELLVQERNLKRRRAKHRGVHTNKKSHTEIIREVISQQMETYVDYVSEQSDPTHTMDVECAETRESSHETMQERTERLYKLFHGSSRNSDDFNSGGRNGGYQYSRRDDLKRERSEERSYRRSKERDRQTRYSDECSETHRKHGRSTHKRPSRDRSRDRKSHKRDKHRSNKDGHKDKHRKRKHKSRDRDRSSERHRSKHSHHKRKTRDKEY